MKGTLVVSMDVKLLDGAKAASLDDGEMVELLGTRADIHNLGRAVVSSAVKFHARLYPFL